MKVIRFARTFPTKHRRKGEPTFFVEQIINWYWETQEPPFNGVEDMIFLLNPDKPADMLRKFVSELNMDIKDWKSHTIRAGSRFKAGDIASMRVWSGRPYHTTDITILPPIKIPKVWQFNKHDYNHTIPFGVNFSLHDGMKPFTIELPEIKKDTLDIARLIIHNDGLTETDFISWFKPYPPFEGQIICWNKDIEY